MKVLHKLHRFYVRPLRIAAYLYNSGKRVRFEDFEKNSFNIILNSDIDGVTQRELLLAAFIGLCQNLDNFNLSDWVKYKSILNDDDLEAVRQLGVMVKLAACLDRGNTGNVKDVTCDILGDSVIIKTIVNEEPIFEIMEAKKIGSQFKKVYNKYIEVL